MLVLMASLSIPSTVAKDFSQYEPIFIQMSEDKKTVNAFELQDLLEACLPNGKLKYKWGSKQCDWLFTALISSEI